MKKRLRKLVLPLFIVFALNELIPSTVHPMAYVLYEGAMLTIAAAEAIGLGELLMGAVVLAEAAHEIQISHAAAQVACTYIAAQHGSRPPEGAAITAIGRDYAECLDYGIVSHQDIVKTPVAIAALPTIQDRLKANYAPQLARTYAASKKIPYPTCSSPIELKFNDASSKPQTTYIPSGFRTTLGNGYFQLQFKPVSQ